MNFIAAFHCCKAITRGCFGCLNTPEISWKNLTHKNRYIISVRPLLIIGVERDYLRGTICLVPSLTAVLYTSAVYMCTCVCVLSLCGREVV